MPVMMPTTSSRPRTAIPIVPPAVGARAGAMPIPVFVLLSASYKRESSLRQLVGGVRLDLAPLAVLDPHDGERSERVARLVEVLRVRRTDVVDLLPVLQRLLAFGERLDLLAGRVAEVVEVVLDGGATGRPLLLEGQRDEVDRVVGRVGEDAGRLAGHLLVLASEDVAGRPRRRRLSEHPLHRLRAGLVDERLSDDVVAQEHVELGTELGVVLDEEAGDLRRGGHRDDAGTGVHQFLDLGAIGVGLRGQRDLRDDVAAEVLEVVADRRREALRPLVVLVRQRHLAVVLVGVAVPGLGTAGDGVARDRPPDPLAARVVELDGPRHRRDDGEAGVVRRLDQARHHRARRTDDRLHALAVERLEPADGRLWFRLRVLLLYLDGPTEYLLAVDLVECDLDRLLRLGADPAEAAAERREVTDGDGAGSATAVRGRSTGVALVSGASGESAGEPHAGDGPQVLSSSRASSAIGWHGSCM